MEKQRFKHVISLYYRAFLRCSWIKGPNFRTPMKAMGVLSPLKAGRCTPAHSRGRFKHTTKKHVQHPPLPAGGNVHLSFCLYFLLAAGHLEPHPRPGNPPFHKGQALPSPTLDAGWDQAAALRSRALHPQGAARGPGVPCMATSSRCPSLWPAHTASNLSFNHRYPLVQRDYMSYSMSFQWIPSLTESLLLFFAVRNLDCKSAPTLL